MNVRVSDTLLSSTSDGVDVEMDGANWLTLIEAVPESE